MALLMYCKESALTRYVDTDYGIDIIENLKTENLDHDTIGFLEGYAGEELNRLRDDMDPSQGNFRTNPMFARTDAAVSYQLPSLGETFPRMTVYGKIENLFDRNYHEVAGFRSPPLNYLIGVRATF